MKIFGAVAVLLSLSAIGVWTITPLRWRVTLVALKMRGDLDDVSWRTLYGKVAPAWIVASEPERWRTSPVDLTKGAALFQLHCTGCHGANGRGGPRGGIDLTAGTFVYGGSEAALFRTIADGIPGTEMTAPGLLDEDVRQLVGFVQSLAAGTGAIAIGREPDLPTISVPYDRLVRAAEEPESWLTFSGTYNGRRHSTLENVNRDNVRRLSVRWLFQMPRANVIETTPLVVGDYMFATQPPNEVIALDARTGRQRWSYRHALPARMNLCDHGPVNRGLAVLDDTLYVGTLDARLIALSARTGKVRWDAKVADYGERYSITGAPLALKGKIITGTAGGDCGARGFIDAYDAKTGERAWRRYTIPGPGEAGHETWADDSWKTGGVGTWMTGTFDPELNLLYWGTGNPRGDGRNRAGDNLYANSVLALDADTGQLRWHFQFNRHDVEDWDAAHVPVLVDANYDGEPRKLMLFANKNGFVYVIDRETGKLLRAWAFAKQTWAHDDGTPLPVEQRGLPRPFLVFPNEGTSWRSPSYSPRTGLLYVSVSQRGHPSLRGSSVPGVPNAVMYQLFRSDWAGSVRKDDWDGIRALQLETRSTKWERRTSGGAASGILTTAGDLLFAGDGVGAFYALDAHSGEELWRVNLGGPVVGAAMTYMADGAQHLTVAAGGSLITFALNVE